MAGHGLRNESGPAAPRAQSNGCVGAENEKVPANAEAHEYVEISLS